MKSLCFPGLPATGHMLSRPRLIFSFILRRLARVSKSQNSVQLAAGVTIPIRRAKVSAKNFLEWPTTMSSPFSVYSPYDFRILQELFLRMLGRLVSFAAVMLPLLVLALVISPRSNLVASHRTHC